MTRITRISFLLALFVSCIGAVYSEEPDVVFQPRKFYRARLESQNSILHGAGQSRDALDEYVAALPGTPPLMTMHYWNVKDAPEALLATITREIMDYTAKGIYLIPQIGLQMTTDGKPEERFEHQVSAGLYDDHLVRFVKGLKDLGRPAFIRIGYEFNGLAWNGYEPETYKGAWIRITRMIRDVSPEIATVWCAAIHSWQNPPSLNNARFGWMEYYPGDEWVDWWGIDIFEKEEFRTPPLKEFLREADVHGKPVMIGESTPKKVGVLQGRQSWDKWFDPWFRTMAENPGIKAVCYINWDWSRYPQWKDWGDARIQRNPEIRNLYAALIAYPVFLHGTSEERVRTDLGVVPAGSGVPGKPVLATVTGSDGIMQLSLSPSGGAAVLRYEIEREGSPAGLTTARTWVDPAPKAGLSVSYTARAVGMTGAYGNRSDPLSVSFPPVLAKLRGGGFDGDHNFYLRQFEGGTARLTVANRAASVQILRPTGTDWHIQFVHPLRVYADRIYTLRATLSADRPSVIRILYQKAEAPYTVYLAREERIGPRPRAILIRNFKFSATDDIFLSFMMGAMSEVTVTLTDIGLEEVVP